MAYGSKGNLLNTIFTKLTLAVILVLCVFMAISVYNRYTVEREMAERRYTAETEYRELEERRNSLFDKVEYLKGDSGREFEIRKHFDVAKDGEQVVVIVDDENEEKLTFTEGIKPDVDTGSSWWQFWR